MTPKKLIPKKKRQRSEAGQSSQKPEERHTQQQETPIPTISTPLPSWDRFKFKTMAKYQRFLELQPRELLSERNVQLDEGEYVEFQDEIKRRKWEFLANLPNQINEDIVKEFYANAWPLDIKNKDKRSWVRRVEVCYDRDAINALLGNPLTLQEGELCQYQQKRSHATGILDGIVAKTLCIPGKSYETNAQGKPMRFKRQSLKTLAQIWTSFLFANIAPTTHTSDVRMSRAYLIYSIMEQITVDIATVITEEIQQFVISNPSPSAATTKPLGFPALITALCVAQGVQIPDSSRSTIKLKKPINVHFIKNYCTNPLEQPVAASHLSSSPRPLAPASEPDLTPMEFRLTRHLTHLHQQMAANHRAYTQLNYSFYMLTLHQHHKESSPFSWPTPEEFAAHVSWPGDNPRFQEEEDQNEDEARQREEGL